LRNRCFTLLITGDLYSNTLVAGPGIVLTIDYVQHKNLPSNPKTKKPA
jgi:hypothetical protein